MRLPESMKEYGMLKGKYMAALILMVIVVFLGGAFIIAFTVGSSECAYNAKQYGKPTHYHKLYGCYIEVEKGQSISIDRYNGYKTVK